VYCYWCCRHNSSHSVTHHPPVQCELLLTLSACSVLLYSYHVGFCVSWSCNAQDIGFTVHRLLGLTSSNDCVLVVHTHITKQWKFNTSSKHTHRETTLFFDWVLYKPRLVSPNCSQMTLPFYLALRYLAVNYVINGYVSHNLPVGSNRVLIVKPLIITWPLFCNFASLSKLPNLRVRI